MYPELTTLLPKDRERAIRREYFVRLATIIILGAAGLTLAAAALLAPSYAFLLTQEKNKTDRLALVESTLVSSDEAALSARLAALSADADQLTKLGQHDSVMGRIRAVLSVDHAGVSITNIAYAPSTGKTTVSISGMATTRNALRAYQLALAGAAFSSGADLPVSAYAKDADIPFTVTVTLAQ